MTKKTIMNVVIILIVVVAIVAAIIAVNKNKQVEQQISESEVVLTDSTVSDTTEAINQNLGEIDASADIDTEFKSIDDQLNNL